MTDEKAWKRVSDNLYLHLPSGVYYARKFRAGKGRFFKSTGETRKGHAQSMANDMISEWLYGKNPLNKHSLISEVCDKLLVTLEEDFRDGKRSPKTHEHDHIYLKQVKDHFGHLYINELDEAYWMDWVRNHGRKLNRRLADLSKYLSKVLSFAHLQKLIDRKPKIKNPDAKNDEVHTYSLKEIRAILNKSDPVIKDIIVLAAECGCRPYESRQLKWDMIHFGKQVTIQLPAEFTKTRTYREFIAGPMTSEMLRKRYKKRSSEFVFPAAKDPKKPINEMTFSKKWRVTVRAAGLPAGSKFHWLRHSFFSTALLEAKLPLPKVAAYGGNSPKILFDRYLSKRADRTSDVAGAVKLGEEE